MIKFKELISEKSFNKELDFPSVTVKLLHHTLSLKFDSKDVVTDAAYTGVVSPWMGALCYISREKSLNELLTINWSIFDETFKNDQMYWDLKQEEENHLFHKHFEILKAALDVFRGREYLYQDTSPLVCRCFGIRESDILDHLQTEKMPTLETLAGVSKAGMGCRSCVPQLKRWLVLHETNKRPHHFKNRPVSEWILEIDYMLSCYPLAEEWKMEISGMKNNRVIVSYNKSVTQLEEEKTAKELQDFLGAALDSDLAFFLRRARHFS
jgi:bacterioferritin-associated ferredoxin